MSSPYDDLVPKSESTPKPEETNMKSIFKSKTLWANVIGGVVALVAALTNSDIVANNPEYAGYAATAMAVLNIVLRLVTKEPVSVTGK